MPNIALFALLIFGQYFGQNKIQYKDFQFRILNTEHFDIYFYPGGENLAAFASDVLEDGYEQLKEDLGVEVEFRIPVIIYNSRNDFSQTNVTLELIEESVGGFTEILKNRMVIPFTGDYEELRHVLIHELTHVFQFVIFFPKKLQAMLSGDLFYTVPLWVMEGSAEFESQGWNLEAELFMQDLVMNNKVIPLQQLENHVGYIIYKEGQAFFHYVAEKYGRRKVGEFLHSLKAKKNLQASFLHVFGLTVEEFNNRWLRYYQLKYWPRVYLQENFDAFARVVYHHKKTGARYNTSPAISPNGDKIAFISDQQGTAEIIVISSIDGRILKRLVRSSYSAGYEGLHLYQGGLDWSNDEKFICFAAKSKGEDVLYIINSRDGRVYKKFSFALDGIYSPQFSADDKKIVFSGLKDSYLDIYLLEIKSRGLTRITDDIYADKYPTILGGDTIIFVSDRPDSTEEYRYGNYAVFVSKQGGFERLTPRGSYVVSPFIYPDSGIFFVADFDSAYNLYFYSWQKKAITKRTDILSGIYYPSSSKDGNKIAFVYYNDLGYDVCVAKEPLSKMTDCEIPREEFKENTFEEIELAEKRVRNYRTKFTFDHIVASVSYSPVGFSGMTEIGLSDILGDHQILVSTNFYGSLTNSDIFLNYWYLKKRTDYGLALFQYRNYFAEGRDLIARRYLGIGSIAQYPLDRFLRLETGIFGYRLYETRWLDFFPDYYADAYEQRSSKIFYPQLALVFDNVQWAAIGPYNGRRFRITSYATIFSDYTVRSAILDWRRYFSLSPRASFAAKLVFAGSFAKDLEYWSIGGTGSLRGYDYYSLTGSKLGFMNLEYRFPFIDRLKIAFPLPLEIKNIRGVLFADLAGIYTDSFKIYETTNGFRLKDLHLGIGGGLRMTLLFIILKFDLGRAYNFQSFTDDWKFYLSLGPEW